jgi:hypothetical protein
MSKERKRRRALHPLEGEDTCLSFHKSSQVDLTCLDFTTLRRCSKRRLPSNMPIHLPDGTVLQPGTCAPLGHSLHPPCTVRPHVLALTVATRRLVHAAAYYRMRFESSVMGQHMVRGCAAPLERELPERSYARCCIATRLRTVLRRFELALPLGLL